MANRNIQIKNRNGASWDILYPLTLLSNVLDKNGKSMASTLDELTIILTPTGGDDTAQLQEAFDRIEIKGGGTVKLCHGSTSVFQVYNRIYVAENTTVIVEKGVIIRKMADAVRCLLDNKGTHDMGGYLAAGNIVIDGGVWDCKNNPNGGNGINFSHSHDVVVKNATFINQYGHAIELNSTDGAVVDNCIFLGNSQVDTVKEAVQIDVALNGSLLGVFDGTASRNIEVKNCKFDADPTSGTYYGTGVGSHSASEQWYENISIHDNVFIGCRNRGINGLKWKNAKIYNNTFIDNNGAIMVRDSESVEVYSNMIDGTIVSGIVVDTDPSNPILASKFIIRDNIIKSVLNGINLSRVKNVSIYQNQFEDVENACVDSQSAVLRVSDISITENQCERANKFFDGTGLRITISRNKIIDIFIAIHVNSASNSAALAATEAMTIEGNQIHTCESSGIVGAYGDNSRVIGNRISSLLGNHGVYWSLSKHIQISDNVFVALSNAGITVPVSTTYPIVTDNIFMAIPGSAGARLAISSAVKTVTGNVENAAPING